MKRAVAIVAVAFLCVAPIVCNASDSSLFQVIVTHLETDPFRPWQTKRPGFRAGYGVVIGKGRILTTEHLVRNARVVELRSPRSAEKIQASVKVSDPEVNLALLSFDTDDGRDAPPPSALARKVQRGDRLEIQQFDETVQTQIGEGRLIQIEMDDLPSAPYQSLSFELLTDLNMNGEGAPAFLNGRLAALITSYDRSRRMAGAISLPMIERFLERATGEKYTGFPSQSFSWIPLPDPAKRDYLGLSGTKNGVLVLSCIARGNAPDSLQPGDVILECDGHPVDNLGYYEDPDFGRIEFTFIMKGHRKCGDTIRIKAIRDGKPALLSLELKHIDDNSLFIPENPVQVPEEYLIAGGFVIRELSGSYVRAHGMEWSRRLDQRLTQIYLARNNEPHEPGERVVILSSVLPDEINIGYQHFQNAIVTAVNGQKVKNIGDVFKLADTEGVRSVRIKAIDVDLVLDDKEIGAANARLSRTYRIPRLTYRKTAQ